MARRKPWQKMVGTMYVLQKSDRYAPHTLTWKARTGRLPTNIEYGMMKEFKQRTASDLYRTLSEAEGHVGSFANESESDMVRKGWLKKSDYARAKRYKKYL